MGKLIRFPGAQVDYEFLDSFEWTNDPLREGADRAHFLLGLLDSHRCPEDGLPRWPTRPMPRLQPGATRPYARRYRLGNRKLRKAA